MKKEVEEKLSRYEAYFAQDPQNISLLLHIIEYCMELRNFYKARDYLEILLQIEPKHSGALGLKAQLEYDYGDETIAETLASEALKLDPEDYNAQVVLLSLSEEVDHSVIEKIEHLMHVQADDARLWFLKGYQQLALFDAENAEYSLRKAIELFDEYYDAFSVLIWALLLQNKNQEAMNIAKKLRLLAPQSAEAMAAMALMHALLGEEKKAGSYLQKAIKLKEPGFMCVLAELVLLKKSNAELAKIKFEQLFGHSMRVFKALFEQMLFIDKTVH